MGSDFAKFKFAWLEAVASDADVSDAECRVALIVSIYVNSQSREAWMSVETLARRAHCSRRSAQRALSALVATGYLERQAQSGRGHTNVYRPLMRAAERVSELSPFEPEKVSAVTPFEVEKVSELTPFPERERVTTVSPLPPERVSNLSPKGDSRVTQNNMKNNLISMNHGIEVREEGNRHGDKRVGGDFTQFWNVYPRREGRDRAQRAFNSAVRSGVPPAILIAGAQRYAANQRGQEQRYIAMPSNWLRDRRWLDAPPGGPVIDQAGNVVETPVANVRQAPRRASHEEQALALFKVKRDE